MSVLSNDEFAKKYNYYFIDKCCYTCKHSTGYIEWLACAHPENKTDNGTESVVDARGICDEWVEKPLEDFYAD
jgi:hypothetical protein